MISAETTTPAASLISPASPASRTSPSVILSPASPASFSTAILSPAATRYCLPPVRTIANIVQIPFLQAKQPGDESSTTGQHAGTPPRQGAGKRGADSRKAPCCQRREPGNFRRAGKRRRVCYGTRMRRLLPLALLVPALAACAGGGRPYPSLDRRPAERMTG